jgi:purine-binding chemotaxis protein CheW
MNQAEKNTSQFTQSAENRYLCFSLGGEHFAIPLLQVKEVIGIPEFTSIPYVASYFCGIMNLRGQVISVIDLRKKLSVTAKKSEENSVLVCVLDNIVMGALVDSVDFVVNVDRSRIMSKPNVQTAVKIDFIEGFYEHNKHLIIFLNLAKTLSIQDLVDMTRVMQENKNTLEK